MKKGDRRGCSVLGCSRDGDLSGFKVFCLGVGGRHRADQRGWPSPVLDRVSWVESLDDSSESRLAQFGLSDTPQFLHDSEDQADAASQQFPVDAPRPSVSLYGGRPVSAGEMKPAGFSADGDDHSHRDTVLSSRHQFAHANRDQFLAGRDVTGHGMPVAENFFVQAACVKQFSHP